MADDYKYILQPSFVSHDGQGIFSPPQTAYIRLSSNNLNYKYNYYFVLFWGWLFAEILCMSSIMQLYFIDEISIHLFVGIVWGSVG